MRHPKLGMNLIAIEVIDAFAAEANTTPAISLRAGNAMDDYDQPLPFDEEIDRVTDEYLNHYSSGIRYLDPVSFRHYLPHLIEYALRHLQQGSNVGDSLIDNLRPPDHEPPRLASLSEEQEAVVVRFLDALAFSEASAHKEAALQALEEWWAPGALYRLA